MELRNSCGLSFYNLAREYQLGARCSGMGKSPWRAKEALFDNVAKGAIANRSVGPRIV
jgi:hypothetical protein